jgi:hypothetical protein
MSRALSLPPPAHKILLWRAACVRSELGGPLLFRHGFTYIRGWMQMVLAPNDLFSWNNKAMSTMLLRIFTLSSCWLCTLTHSVHARILKPWRGRLPSVFSLYHVFSPPLSGLNWRSLTPSGGPGPFTSKITTLSTGSAHTPSLGSKTVTWQVIFSYLGWQDFHGPGLIWPGFLDFWYFLRNKSKSHHCKGKSWSKKIEETLLQEYD